MKVSEVYSTLDAIKNNEVNNIDNATLTFLESNNLTDTMSIWTFDKFNKFTENLTGYEQQNRKIMIQADKLNSILIEIINDYKTQINRLDKKYNSTIHRITTVFTNLDAVRQEEEIISELEKELSEIKEVQQVAIQQEGLAVLGYYNAQEALKCIPNISGFIPYGEEYIKLSQKANNLIPIIAKTFNTYKDKEFSEFELDIKNSIAKTNGDSYYIKQDVLGISHKILTKYDFRHTLLNEPFPNILSDILIYRILVENGTSNNELSNSKGFTPGDVDSAGG